MDLLLVTIPRSLTFIMELTSSRHGGRSKDSMRMKGFIALLLYVRLYIYCRISHIMAFSVSWTLCIRFSAFMRSTGEVELSPLSSLLIISGT